jgi:hypothetical protein
MEDRRYEPTVVVRLDHLRGLLSDRQHACDAIKPEWLRLLRPSPGGMVIEAADGTCAAARDILADDWVLADGSTRRPREGDADYLEFWERDDPASLTNWVSWDRAVELASAWAARKRGELLARAEGLRAAVEEVYPRMAAEAAWLSAAAPAVAAEGGRYRAGDRLLRVGCDSWSRWRDRTAPLRGEPWTWTEAAIAAAETWLVVAVRGGNPGRDDAALLIENARGERDWIRRSDLDPEREPRWCTPAEAAACAASARAARAAELREERARIDVELSELGAP